jgi:hypothetical protein
LGQRCAIERGRILALAALLVLGMTAAHAQQLTSADMEITPRIETIDGVSVQVVRVPVDNSGVADWKFVNARRPPFVAGRTANFRLEFVNATSGRTIKVSLPETTKPAEPLALAEQRLGAKITECDDVEAGAKCVPTLTIPAGGNKSVTEGLLRTYDANTVIKFSVAFYDELETPSKPSGYLVIDKLFKPAPIDYAFTAVGTVQHLSDAYYGPVADPPAMVPTPYDGKQTHVGKAVAKLGMSYDLGSRANALIDLQIRDGAMGTIKDPDTPPVKPLQYSFTVNGMTGSSLRFGKFDFAVPADGLGVKIHGEGVKARFRWFAVSHVVRRESKEFGANANNEDDRLWMGEVSNVSLDTPVFRSFSTIAVFGEDRTPGRSRSYSTIGGEIPFGFVGLGLDGLAAGYVSQSRPLEASAATKASGSVAMVRLSRVWMQENVAQRSAVVTFARSSGDNPMTPDFEGYTGDTANYALDGSSYLSTIVPRTRLVQVPLLPPPPASTATPLPTTPPELKPEFARRGLQNLSLVHASFTEQKFSPLEALAKLIRIPQGDIESRQTTVRVLRFSSVEAPAKFGAIELQAETLLESPKGVKYTLLYSLIHPTGAMASVLAKKPSRLLAQCTVSFKKGG